MGSRVGRERLEGGVWKRMQGLQKDADPMAQVLLHMHSHRQREREIQKEKDGCCRGFEANDAPVRWRFVRRMLRPR